MRQNRHDGQINSDLGKSCQKPLATHQEPRGRVDEAGLPGFYISVWNGVWAPKGTPSEIVAKLAVAFSRALDDETLVRKLTTLGQRTSRSGHRKPWPRFNWQSWQDGHRSSGPRSSNKDERRISLSASLGRQFNERPRETLQFEIPAERFSACVASTVEPATRSGHGRSMGAPAIGYLHRLGCSRRTVCLELGVRPRASLLQEFRGEQCIIPSTSSQPWGSRLAAP
jgi:hypothetical protein